MRLRGGECGGQLGEALRAIGRGAPPRRRADHKLCCTPSWRAARRPTMFRTEAGPRRWKRLFGQAVRSSGRSDGVTSGGPAPPSSGGGVGLSAYPKAHLGSPAIRAALRASASHSHSLSQPFKGERAHGRLRPWACSAARRERAPPQLSQAYQGDPGLASPYPPDSPSEQLRPSADTRNQGRWPRPPAALDATGAS